MSAKRSTSRRLAVKSDLRALEYPGLEVVRVSTLSLLTEPKGPTRGAICGGPIIAGKESRAWVTNSVRLILGSVSSIEKDTPPVSVHTLGKFLGN